MYKQVLDPVSHSLGLTSIFAVLPLLVLFVLLGIVRMKAQWAALITLGVAIVVAIAVYSMPAGQAFDAGAEGADDLADAEIVVAIHASILQRRGCGSAPSFPASQASSQSWSVAPSCLTL